MPRFCQQGATFWNWAAPASQGSIAAGVALHVMWTGLAAYVLKNDIDILFGVASFHGQDPQNIAQALAYLHHNHMAPPEIRVTAKPDAYIDMNILPADDVDRPTAMRQIPALIKSYLRLGGVVGQGAYLDADFNTIDVCLMMDTERMAAGARDRLTAGIRESAG